MESQTDSLPQRNHLSRIGWSLSAMIAMTIALQFILALLLKNVLNGAGEVWLKYALLMTVQYLFAMPAAAWLLHKVPTMNIPKNRIGLRQFFIAFLIVYFLIIAGNLMGNLINMILRAILGTGGANPVANLVVVSTLWMRILILVVAAPIAEELFFRKMLIGRLICYGERNAVMISGLVFGLAHGNISQFFYAFGIGLLLGVVYIKTGRLAYTIILHMIINLLGIVITPFIIGLGGSIVIVYGLLAWCAAIAGFVQFFRQKKMLAFEPGIWELPNWKTAMMRSPGMVMFMFCCAGLFVLSM
jgi:membrane protease YdiL (CAAX protease family)